MASNNQPASWVMSLIEKHGLATVLLLVGGYYVTQTVVEPMVATARQFVADIREVNQEMEKAYLQAQAENLERWRQVWDLLGVKKQLVEEALTRLQRLEDSDVRLLRELEKLRMLLTRPSVERIEEVFEETR